MLDGLREANDERDRLLRETANPDCTLCRGKGTTRSYVGPGKYAAYACTSCHPSEHPEGVS